MESVLAMLFVVFAFAAIIAFKKWYESSQERSLRHLVDWSTSSDNHVRCNLSLSDYIYKAQIRLSLSQEYRIAGDEERKILNKILGEYQKDLMQAYFAGRLVLPKSKYVIQGEDYFMFTLYAFLSGHQSDYEFLGHNMRKATDFSVVLHKMHYITYMYCCGSEIFKNYVPEWNEEMLKEILDAEEDI